jgi:DNA-binding transcriptional regulator of glucitol operon
MPVEPKKNRTGIIIAVVVIVLCCCCLVGGGLGYWLWQNGDNIFGTGATGALLNSLALL